MSNGEAPKDVDRFIKDVDRFIQEFRQFMQDRGPKDVDRGSDAIVEDVFRRASGLNGFLVVSFVAPVAGYAPQAARRGLRAQTLSEVAQQAGASVPQQTSPKPVDPETLQQFMELFQKYGEQQKLKPKA